jgi:hypothetical protein
MSSPGMIAIGFFASIVAAGLASAGAASAASQTHDGARLHGRLTMQHARLDAQHAPVGGRGSRLGLEALGVTGSYGYGDDYPSYGSSAYRGDSGRSRVASRGVLSEGRAAAVDEEPSGYFAPRAWAYDPPESIYGRQTQDYGPGVTYAAPVSPYRWAYSSEDFPGTEFMRGR